MTALSSQGLSLQGQELLSDSVLQVSFSPDGVKQDVCEPEATGGFLKPDNQLIRVQVASAKAGNLGDGTLVWGYDGASFQYRASVVNIDYPGAATVALGINNLGVVAGYFSNSTGLHGFTYSNGTFTQIDRPNAPNGTAVNGINDRNDLVGVWYPSIGFWKTFKAAPVTGPQQP